MFELQVMFHGGAKMNPNIKLDIKECVKKSHERCRAKGLDVNIEYSNKIIKGTELRDVLNRKSELIEISKPFIEQLYKFVKDSGFFTILNDEKGCILNVIGDEDILEEAFSYQMIPGAYMDEENIGTNAMSLAITEKKPVQISGDDHYIRAYHRWTCSAAPIRDINNNIIGILDLTGYSHTTHPHTLGMVVAAVNAIEKTIQIKAYNEKIEMDKNYIETILNSISSGIMTSDLQGNIITINKDIIEIFKYTEEEIKRKKVWNMIENWENIIETIESKGNFLEEDVFINSKKGALQFNLSAYPILDNKQNLNYVTYIFKEVKKIRRLANKIMGRQAVYTFDKIIGENKEFVKTIEFAKKISNSKSTILLLGESGTGKDIFAQSIHNYSSRKNEAFVTINCGAIPKNLIESEFFGYEEGAFTGAIKGGRAGKFELADEGTIFLDEIGEMPLDMQTRLLRIIENDTVERIGSPKHIAINTRIIAATNKNLVDEVKIGNFRKDLFYRLNVLPIKLPSLRERKDDIPLLIEYFIDKISKKINKPKIEISKEYLDILMEYNWPGNIRELENQIELILNTGNIDNITDSINISNINSQKAIETDNFQKESISKFKLEDIEKEHMEKVLKHFENNITNSAKALGIGRNTLYRKIDKYNINV